MRAPQRALAAALLAALATSACGGEPPATEGFVQAMNEGKAYLENKDSAAAIDAFGRAVAEAPESAAARRNLARAQLLARDHDAALATLEEARRLDPDDPGGEYLSGLALAREGRHDEAVTHLEAAVRLDPDEAPLRFQLANAYQALARTDEAAEQLRETVRLDPLHASAHFKLATVARQTGDRAASEHHQQEFLRLREIQGDATRSAEALETSRYTLAEPAAASDAPAAAAADAPAVRFALADDALPAGPAPAVAAAVLAVDEAGRPTLVTVDGEGRLALLEPAAGGGFSRRELAARVPFAPDQALVGNFYDPVAEGEPYDPAEDARNDLLLLGDGAAALLLADGAELVDVTAAAGAEFAAGLAAAVRAAWVDADHDGDLDLAAAGPAGLRLFQNHGDGGFSEVTEAVGATLDGAAADVAAADLDGDVAVDLVVARGAAGTAVLDNQRAGSFARRPEPPGPWPPATRVALDDFDNDGRPDALLVAAGEAVIVPAAGGRQTLGLGGGDPAPARIDFDNDGWLDLAVAAGDGVRLWRNGGAGGWAEVTAASGLDSVTLPAVSDLVAADLDGDGDSDLVAVTAQGLRRLDNRGGDANRQLVLRLVGTKTNPGGIGTHVEVRAGELLVSRQVDGPLVAIGIGASPRLDSVQTLWTNGVVDNQVGVETAADGPTVLTIAEKNVATGSCPFLYAWDGDGFRFVTDLLGNSPVGLPLTRDVLLPADPDELVVIGGPEALAPRLADGTAEYVFEVTSEFREVLYLDHARLVAVDHPPAVEIGVTDKIMPPPFPPSEAWPLAGRRPLLAAVGDDGVDRTAELAEADGAFAECGVPLPPPYRGMTEPLALTLDFGPLAGVERPVLALTGWLQYGDGSTNIALSQNRSVTVIPPRLEVETGGGGWQPVDAVVGMPAGKTKTVLVDLEGLLPPDARRLRLVTTFEIRWDRAALFERAADSAVVARHELAPRAVELYERGFSDLRQRTPRAPTTPDYRRVSARPPWRTTPEGWSTRYGDVTELVAGADGRVLIVNAGDAARLRFDAGELPPPAPGLERTFLFYSVGWDKDSDHNVIDGDTVGPLPDGVDPGPEWQTTWNTRWVARDKHGR